MTLQEMHEAVCAKMKEHGAERDDIRLHLRASAVRGADSRPGYVAWWASARFPDNRYARHLGFRAEAATMEAAIERAFDLTMAAP